MFELQFWLKVLRILIFLVLTNVFFRKSQLEMNLLTLALTLCIRYFWLLLVHNGDPIGPLPLKPAFLKEFLSVSPKTTINEQKQIKNISRFKMAANILISISQKRSRDKTWKSLSKRIFQWKLAQSRRVWIDLHYWNKIVNKIILFENGGQNNFCDIA